MQKSNYSKESGKLVVRFCELEDLINMGKQTDKETYLGLGRYPAVRVAILLMVGVAAGHYLEWNWALNLSLLIVPLSVTIALEMLHARYLRPVYRYWILHFYGLSIILFGLFWYSWQTRPQPRAHALHLSLYEWETLPFFGSVETASVSSSGKWVLTVEVDSLYLEDNLTWPTSFKMNVFADPEEVSFPGVKEPFELPGHRIHFLGKLYPLEEPRNPHQFDYKEYLASKGIFHQAGMVALTHFERDESQLSWTFLRKKVYRQIHQNYSEEVRPLAKALLTGEKGSLDYEVKQSFSRAGISHIMAVSGLHVGFLVGPIWLLLPFLRRRRFGKIAGVLLTLTILVLYAGITNFSPSVNRAGLMALLLVYGKLYHKNRNSLNLMGVAALLQLLWDPLQLFGAGFQLSYAAVVIIITVWPVLQNAIPLRIRHRKTGKLLGIIGVSVVVQLGLFPILSGYFGEISLIGPLLNALIVPAVGILLPIALYAVPVGFVIPVFGKAIAWVFSYFLYALDWIVSTVAAFEFSWMAYTTPNMWITVLLWASAVAIITLWWQPKLRWRWAVMFLGLLVVQQVVSSSRDYLPGKLDLLMFDVGQGDAVFLQFPNGKTMLIDTGAWRPGYVAAERVILPFLAKQNIRSIDALVHTHPHADHIGGSEVLLQNISVDTVYTSGSSYTSGIVERFRTLAMQKKVPIRKVSAGDRLQLDSSVNIRVLGPIAATDGSDPNNHSVVLLVSYGEMDFLFTGDASRKQEERLVEAYGELLDTEFLKIGHHTSKTSSTSPFLERVTPEIAAASLGDRNKFGHPHREAVNRLGRFSEELHFTSRDRALWYQTDGQRIVQVAWAQD